MWSYRAPDTAMGAEGPEPLNGEWVRVVVIEDDSTRWQLVLSDATAKSRVVSFTMVNGSVTPARLREVPLSDLRDAALGHLQEVARLAEEFDSRSAAELAAVEPGDLSLTGDPSLTAFAQAWEGTPARVITEDGEVIRRRQSLAKRYGVSPAAIDKRARRARDAGLITSKARPGRPRKDTNPTEGTK